MGVVSLIALDMCVIEDGASHDAARPQGEVLSQGISVTIQRYIHTIMIKHNKQTNYTKQKCMYVEKEKEKRQRKIKNGMCVCVFTCM